MLASLVAALALNVSAEDGRDHVLDFVGTLSDSEIKSFEEKLVAIGEKYEEELVVAIVDENSAVALQEEFNESYYSLMSIADDIYDYGGYGAGEKKSGMLILLRIGEPYSNHFHLSTAGDLIGRCDSDEDIDYVYYNAKPYLVSGNYYKAVDECVNGMEKLIADAKGFHPVKKVLISLAIGFVIALIVVLVMKSKLKSVSKKNQAADYVVPGSFYLRESRDLYLYSHVSRTARAESSSGGGSHTSSSGVSHGGGTR